MKTFDEKTVPELLKIARKAYRDGGVMVIEPENTTDRHRYFIHVVPIVKSTKSKIEEK